MKEKQIQIPESLFSMLIMKYIIGGEVDESVIKKALEKKLESIEKHMYYTKSKTALTDEERESAREKYLNCIGMQSEFRW